MNQNIIYGELDVDDTQYHLCMANCQSGRDRQLEWAATMRLPPELVEIDSIDDNFPTEFNWRIATERCMDTMPVVEIPKFVKLSVQVTSIPKEHVI